MANIGIFVSYNERPGIYIQIENWKRVFERLGYNTYIFSSTVLPESLFHYSITKNIYKNALIKLTDYNEIELLTIIEKIKERIKHRVELFIENNDINILILENILSGARDIPYGMALVEIVHSASLYTIGHHHIFWWEVPGLRPTCSGIRELTDKYFPPTAPNIVHVTVNSIAQATLRKRRGISSRIIPYMVDLDKIPPHTENKDNTTLSLFYPYYGEEDEGIKIASEIARRMEKSRVLKSLNKSGVTLLTQHFSPDIDFLLYTKTYEPWGDYLLEAIKLGIPTLVYPYKVFKRDISHFEFDLIIFQDIDNAISKMEEFLLDKRRQTQMKRHNLSILKKCFSLDMLEKYLSSLLKDQKTHKFTAK